MNNDSTHFSETIDAGSQLVYASTLKRFLNLIIDLALFFLIIIGVGVVLIFLAPETLATYMVYSEANGLVERLFSIMLYAVIMGLTEGFTNGRSLGKLITGTRAVNEDGTSISFGTALKRGFIRALPFVQFSAFGNPCLPWQDRWTNTCVIDLKQSETNELGNIPDSWKD
jgi:hypothetical protein